MRKDGRKFDELRPVTAKVGVLKNAEGSAMFRLGNTMAIAGVFGPRKVYPKHQEEADRAILRTRYKMAPFSTTQRIRPGYSRREIEISMVTRQALQDVIFLEEFPKTAIDVHIEILQAEASTRCVGINAAALALADAGVPMADIISSCSAGKINVVDKNGATSEAIVLDIAGEEDTEGLVDMPVAYCPRNNKVTLLQMDGLASSEELKKIIKLAIGGCKKIHDVQKEALKKKFMHESETE